jgi:hypothetical protein
MPPPLVNHLRRAEVASNNSVDDVLVSPNSHAAAIRLSAVIRQKIPDPHRNLVEEVHAFLPVESVPQSAEKSTHTKTSTTLIPE